MTRDKPTRRGGRGPVALDDWHLWAEVRKTVDPLRRRLDHAPLDREGLEKAVNSPPEADRPAAPPPARPGRRLRPTGPAPVPAQGYTFGRATPPVAETIEPGLGRKIRKGRLPLDATLDLHGMTQEAAHEALARFVVARAGRGDRTLLVITGKGMRKTGYLQLAERGVLRHAVPRWLALPPLSDVVAGVEAAHPVHGGEGALYVRLRNTTRDRSGTGSRRRG